jgi:NitT/TauT family transport system permease protein
MSTLAEHILPGREGRPGRGLPGESLAEVRASAVAPQTEAAAIAAPRAQLWWQGALASVAWAVLAALTHFWPNLPAGFTEWAYTAEFAAGAAVISALLLALVLAPESVRPLALPRRRLRPAGPWLIALALGFAAWEVLTAKLGRLPTPFFAPPQALVEVYATDAERLAESALHSLRLLAIGIGIGALVGFVTGVLIGWSRTASYWIHPVLRVLGPVPTTALLPVSFYFFPSSWSTAVFLIALGMAFPVAILTWSGVAGVHKNFYDVARTLGASQWFLVLRVAIPAALPQVFVAADPNMYAALILMALLFSGVITLLFAFRDRVLSWQKGTLKW